MLSALRRFDRTELALILALIITCLAVVVYTAIVSPRIEVYRGIAKSEIALGAAIEGGTLDDQLAKLVLDVESLQHRLHGDMASMPEKQIEAHVIGRLQRLSWKNNIQLVGIEPMAGETIESFRELLFHVNLSGDYFEMYQWLQDVSDELGFVLIKKYEMQPLEGNSRDSLLAVNLTMATYRALQQ